MLVIDDDQDEFGIASRLRADGNYRVEWVSGFESVPDAPSRPDTADLALIDHQLDPAPGST